MNKNTYFHCDLSLFYAMPSHRLFAITAERIFALIQDRGLQPGQKLPSEAELVSVLDVSRATVREAIVALEVAGVVRVRKNAGAFVGPQRNFIASAIEAEEVGPFEQLEARLALEPFAASLAAQRRSDAACDTMEATIVRMLEEHESGFKTEEGDRDFHYLIAEESGNIIIAQSIKFLWRMRENSQLWPQLQRRVEIQKWRSRAVYEHMRILNAIRESRPDDAFEEMKKHLLSVKASLEEAFL